MNSHMKVRIASVTGMVLLASAATAQADIDLEYRPDFQSVTLGDIAEVGLYAVSDSAVNQSLSAADVVFDWDTTYLQLIGLDQTGAAPLLSSSFPLADPYGLNEAVPPQDGDGLYTAFASFSSAVDATPAGTLLTTFRFQTLALTPGTPVDILTSGGNPSIDSRVFDGVTPNTIVTGTLSGAVIEIVPEPASALLLMAFAPALLRIRRRG